MNVDGKGGNSEYIKNPSKSDVAGKDFLFSHKRTVV
jgi:hypothetical protein